MELYCAVKSLSFTTNAQLYQAGQIKWNSLKTDSEKLQEFYDGLLVKKFKN